ncbi:hypothetical protein SRHO_G00003830 [Serrasalmus rhombeus]
MDSSGALSPGLDPLLAVLLRELELEINIQEREAEVHHLEAVQVSAERDLELRRLSLAGDKPVPLPRSTASFSARLPTTAGPQAAAAPPVPKPRSPARSTAGHLLELPPAKVHDLSPPVSPHLPSLKPPAY